MRIRRIIVPEGFLEEVRWHARLGHRARLVPTPREALVLSCSCKIEIMTTLRFE